MSLYGASGREAIPGVLSQSERDTARLHSCLKSSQPGLAWQDCDTIAKNYSSRALAFSCFLLLNHVRCCKSQSYSSAVASAQRDFESLQVPPRGIGWHGASMPEVAWPPERSRSILVDCQFHVILTRARVPQVVNQIFAHGAWDNHVIVTMESPKCYACE